MNTKNQKLFGSFLLILLMGIMFVKVPNVTGVERTITVQWIVYDFLSEINVGDGNYKTGEVYMRVQFFDNDCDPLSTYKTKYKAIQELTADSNVGKSVSYTSACYSFYIHFWEYDWFSGDAISYTYGYSLDPGDSTGDVDITSKSPAGPDGEFTFSGVVN